MPKTLIAALIAAAVASATAAAPAPKPAGRVYRLDAVVPLKGARPAWDYLTFDATRARLFIGRRDAGVTVYDVKARRVVGQIQNAEGANIAALVPEVGRGYTANEDGSTTIFDLASLKTLRRVKLGEGADAAFYEPATGQLAFTMGDSQQLTFIDARTAKVTGHTHIDADEIEGVAPDGKGLLYVAERDKDRIAKVDARTHAVAAEWDVPKCHQPTGVAFDPASNRLFVGCKGEHPVLSVIDVADGRVVAQPEIGRGNDAVRFDPQTRRVFTANGVDGNIVIYDQLGPDSYRLFQAVTTRPIARTLAIDPATKTLYTVTAEGMVDPARPVNRKAAAFYPNVYFDNSFVLLAYGLHPRPAGPQAED
ncbi:MAG: YncE family protein [Caulobacterales bacterium]|nr:YncE family protein [Caulobacterales bacterium]